jgi:Sec-independent protein secretion pathway component TatC
MQQSARLLMGWKVRTLEAYGLSFALIAALVDSIPIGAGSSPTTVSAFLSSLKEIMLPQGWMLLGLSASTQLEVQVIASIVIVFLICYPIAAYAGMRLLSGGSSKRTFAALVVAAVALFYAGAIFGLIDTRFFIASSPSYPDGLPPMISGYDFYTIIMSGIIGWVLAFTAPAYLVAVIKFRGTR